MCWRFYGFVLTLLMFDQCSTLVMNVFWQIAGVTLTEINTNGVLWFGAEPFRAISLLTALVWI